MINDMNSYGLYVIMDHLSAWTTQAILQDQDLLCQIYIMTVSLILTFHKIKSIANIFIQITAFTNGKVGIYQIIRIQMLLVI